ncbi:hypothetical protein [Cesiribacter sp. SM1]|uniref:hypothetical protein n=1 Tax=Cesiribacter sp. SM1 TaxID=2861196 RepID=UPI001CD6C617|nr:hypothetical protein [Cesiribacter sp. SM1]
MANKHELMARMNASRQKKAKQIIEKEIAKAFPDQDRQKEEKVSERTDEKTTLTLAPEAEPAPISAAPALQQEEKNRNKDQRNTPVAQRRPFDREEHAKGSGRSREPKNRQAEKKEPGYKNVALPPSYHRKVSIYAKFAQTNALTFVCWAIDEYLEKEQKAGRLPRIDL